MSKDIPEVPTESRMRKEILGLVWLAMGIFLLLCLGSYSNDDPSFNNNLQPKQINNLIGIFGAHLADLLYQAFGLTALLWPMGCLFLAWRWLKFREVHFRLVRLIAFMLLQITLGGLLALKWHKLHTVRQPDQRGRRRHWQGDRAIALQLPEYWRRGDPFGGFFPGRADPLNALFAGPIY